MQIDLHGYSPDDLGCRYGAAENGGLLQKIVQQAWEMGETDLSLIHGHGHNRGINPGFVNTNTGFFGLCIRRALRRNDAALRQWIKHSTLDCRDTGVTSIKLKPNHAPTRTMLDCLPQEVA
jgi:hypothetical protein